MEGRYYAGKKRRPRSKNISQPPYKINLNIYRLFPNTETVVLCSLSLDKFIVFLKRIKSKVLILRNLYQNFKKTI